jgi:hypothetical protein
MPERKRKAPEELSQNPRTSKERKRLAARTPQQVVFENARKADAEAERRQLKFLHKSEAFQSAADGTRRNLIGQVQVQVREAR